MQSISLTEQQEAFLLEMCKALFPEYKEWEFWNLDSYDDYCGLGGDVKVDNVLVA